MLDPDGRPCRMRQDGKGRDERRDVEERDRMSPTPQRDDGGESLTHESVSPIPA